MKSVFGLDENKAGALSYVGWFVTGIIVLIMEKSNKNVRFHALQSTVFFGAACIVKAVLEVLSGIFLLGGIFALVNWALGIVLFAAYIYLIYSAYKGIQFKIPVIGDVVWDQINK
jgi:uncharacterized membrane protein